MENRLAEDILFIYLVDEQDIETARSMDWISQQANHNMTRWEYDKTLKKSVKIVKYHYVCVRYFRYMLMIENDVLRVLDKKVDSSIIGGPLYDFAE